MITIKEERKAIHEVGLIFSEWGWGFKELDQDWGTDVLVEMSHQGRFTGKIGFLQIKGGKSNFHRGAKGITFYFSREHRDYWLSIAEQNSFFIVLDDFSEARIYWLLFTEDKIVRTSKGFKVIIPFDNLLDVDSKERFENILINYPFEKNENNVLSNTASIEKEPFDIKVIYKIDTKRGLYCSLREKRNSVDIVLGYYPDKDSWDKARNELDYKDPYCFTLWHLDRYIRDKYLSLKSDKVLNILDRIKDEIEVIVKDDGIQKLAEMLFDRGNLGKYIYKYQDFIRAFEQFSGLQKEQYKARVVDQTVEFITDDNEYVLDTYEGKIWELKTLIENERYEEIYTETNEGIWSEIYIDGGIEKAEFIPRMLMYWEKYWDQEYREIEEQVGTTSHLDDMKEKSWRQFQMFEAGYDSAGDVIRYANDLSSMELYPIAVLTMMQVFDRDCCYLEYCEYEFEGMEWTPIYLDESDDPMNDTEKYFYIKELDW